MKIACLRTEEGQTISLTQVLKENEIEKQYEQLVREEGASMFEREGMLNPKQ